MSSHSSEKATLRKYWRDQYPKDASQRKLLSETLRNHIASHPTFKNASVVALFAGRDSEPDITSLWELRPAHCVFPRVIKPSIQFFSVYSLNDLSPGYGKILEPKLNPTKQVNFQTTNVLILVPGTCFDKKGHRLGSGEGFYDRFVGSLTVKPHLFGVCFDEQISKDVLPQDPTDLKVHEIISPSGILSV